MPPPLKVLGGISIFLVLFFILVVFLLNQLSYAENCRGYSNSSECRQSLRASVGIAAAAKNGTIWEGTYPWPFGRKYVGKWKDHRRWEGTEYGKGGNVIAIYSAGVPDIFGNYRGTRVHNKRHGQGTYTWPNGNRYIGEWKDGKQHGKGVYTWWDDERFVGEWKEDNPWEGTVYDPTGNVVATYSEGVDTLVD